MDRPLSSDRSVLARRGMQALGATLLVFAFAPIYRILDTSAEAGYREASVAAAEAALGFGVWGTVLAVLLAAGLAVLLPADAVRRTVCNAATALGSLGLPGYASTLALVSTTLAALVSFGLYRGYLTNVDEMASTFQARYLAHGMLAGPTYGLPEFWLIPNTLVVSEGLVSQYPPTHLFAIAGAEALGIPTLLGPLCFGVMVALLALSFPRLLPERPRTARVAAALVAVSPFLLFLSGGTLNHVSTGALLAAALHAALRAREGSAWWSILAGLAVGLAVADRPLTGLVLGGVLTVGIWAPRLPWRERRGGWWAMRAAGAALGGIPVAVFLGWYNQRLFGSPFTLGYLAAFGERHGLGFHPDPWGYPYGWIEAIGFSSIDMVTVGIQLLETLVPVTVLIGLYLLLGKSFPRAIGLLLAWAFLPVVANTYYWFHSGRMLHEATPAWLALGSLAAVELAGRPAEPATGRWSTLARDGTAWVLVVALLGSLAWGTPDRWRSYQWSQETLDRIAAPSPASDRAAIVFVHTSWNERTSATLQGAGGMRGDTIITALRRNTSCRLHLHAAARAERVRHGLSTSLPEVDLEQRPGAPAEIRVSALPGGGTVRVRDGEPFPAACLRELAADRFGAVALAPLVWQGDLPGIEEGRPLFVRDFGPERNQHLLEVYPDRVALTFTPTAIDSPPELLDYAEAMDLLWGTTAAPASAQPPPGA